ncbi:MAG: hypothetical protein IPM63_12845 [Acidobacteriota bacterium]|nr:MAG: hypothetical protein IPM63_12845 [Acidobacteriota bacterium]
MDETTGFHVDLLFPDEYENFIAEIYFNKDIVCILSQDTGYESIDIEFPSEKLGLFQRRRHEHSFKLKGFEEALAYAKQRLWDLREETSERRRSPTTARD